VANSKAKSFLELVRPKQWVKNLLVFAVPLASRDIIETEVIWNSAITFVCFTLVSAAVYIWNDIRDAESDRLHPLKASRPIARGAVQEKTGIAFLCVLLASGLGLSFWLTDNKVFLVLITYLIIQGAYQTWCKQVVVLDLFCISLGFVLRAISGGFASDIEVSVWFISVTASVALFVISSKRYSEIASSNMQRLARSVLKSYTDSYLRLIWTSSLSISIVFYVLWSTENATTGMSDLSRLSVVPFILIMLRFAMHVDKGRAEEPEKVVLSDFGILALAPIWAAMFLV
jgi:decaprenyl-phosphate phosphoribosyltransferase